MFARTRGPASKIRRGCDQIEDVVRARDPPSQLGTIIDNIGVSYSGLNL